MFDHLAAYRAVEGGDNVSYLLSDSLRIVRCNDAGTRFAKANGGGAMLARWGRGAILLDAISQDLRGFYRHLYARALATNQRVEHDYECSSDQVLRRYRMIILPIPPAFLVVTHALLVERPHDRAASEPDDAAYLHDGVITMCSHCRRVRATVSPERWDWVPAYLTMTLPNLSHGMCPPCGAFYFPP